MNSKRIFAMGLGLGAGLTYLLDPERGRRRRALLRDATIHAATATRDVIGTTSRDLSHRLTGIASKMTRAVTAETVTDEVLVQRVRAKLGQVVSHPHAIAVTVRAGRVTLTATSWLSYSALTPGA